MSSNAENDMSKDDEHVPSRQYVGAKALFGKPHFGFEEQLLKSLKAQQDLMRRAVAVPDLASTITPPSLKAFQSIQRELAYQKNLQKMVSSEIEKSSLAIRSVRDRVIAETSAIASIANVANSFSEVIKRSAIVPQIANGHILSNMRSILNSRRLVEAALRPIQQAIAEMRGNANSSLLSSIRTTIAAQAVIVKQLESVRQSHLSYQKMIGDVNIARFRIEAIGLNKLSYLIDELAANRELVAEWTEESVSTAATQFESELEALPEFRDWDIEKQLRYLIDWTAKQDNEETKRNFTALIINLLSSIIFAMVLQPFIDNSTTSGTNTQIIVNHVRHQVQILMIDSFEATDLHIVCRRSVPLLKSNHRRAQRIAMLQAGCVVRKIDKIGKWMHVEWTDPESGISTQGWMLSKYLTSVDRDRSRFRKTPISIHVE